MAMITISATKARANFYNLIHQVASSDKPIGITRFGVIKAVLISAKQYEILDRLIHGNPPNH